MTKRLTALFSIALISMSSAFAQKYNVKTYSVNDGLPSSYVYDVLIDELGIVWFATANGLVKYDGKNFRKYDSGDGLRDELIYDIYKDSSGDLWISTEFGGVAKYENDSLIYIPELATLDTILVNFISTGPNGTIWFGTDTNGIYEWKKTGEATQKLTKENGLPSNQVWDFTIDEEGNTWIATSNGIAVYEQDGGIRRTFTKKNGLSGDFTYQVFSASNGDKWVPTSNGVSIIRPDYSIQNVTQANGIELGYVFSISEDEEGLMWIGTERKGLFLYDGEVYTHITKKNGLSSNYVYRLIKDDKGNIWVATDGDGVSIFRDKEFLIYDSGTELDANSIYSALKASDGTLWFGTENGISSYKNGKFTNFTLPTRFFDEGEIWDIEELPNGNLIMLGIDYDFIEFDGEKFFHPEFFDDIYEYYVSDILVDEDGTVWFTAFQALLKYENGQLTKFDPPSEKYWQTNLNSIYKDSRGYYWIGTEAGIANFNGNAFNYVTETDGLKGGSIYDVKEDSLGNLWVGTNKGVSILKDFNQEGIPSKIIPFETQDLYMQETIFLQFDQRGNLWQATNGGLNFYDLMNWSEGELAGQQHFPLNDFGHGIEFNGLASILEEDGTLWFGSNSKGIIKFKSSNYTVGEKEERPPKVFLREISANNNVVYNQLSKDSDPFSLGLPYDHNNINFRFNGIDFKNPGRIAYKYKLEGFDNEWHYDTSIDEVRYTSIPPGEYDFVISAKSVRSQWGVPVSIASIKIQKPFWLQGWFFFLTGLSLILLVIAYVKSAIANAEKKNLKLLVDEQTKDIQASLEEKEVLIKEIHHRVKNNLAVVSGLLELQSWNLPEGDAKTAMQDSKLRVLAMSKIHENLYQNKDLAKVNYKQFLEGLVDSISITMKPLDQDIDVDLDIDDTLISVNIGIPIGLMTNEILSNCFKHAFDPAKKGKITVRFEDRGDEYYLMVQDNGKGSKEDILDVDKSSSLGITLTKSLASQINARLKYSGKDGSTFEIEIPKPNKN